MAFRHIVLFGAGGTTIGHHLLQALVADASFHLTILTRTRSKTVAPANVDVVRISDDFSRAELVAALKGQDVLICCGGIAAHEAQYQLVDAAIEAGVQRFIPSEWGMDNADPRNQELCPIFKFKQEVAEYLQTKESSTFSWTAVASSIWLDWALDFSFLDIDPVKHKAEYWCRGTHAPSHTTLPYCAQATIQILKHAQLFKNQRVFLSPFEASQRDVVTELEKAQGVKYDVADANAEEIVKSAQSRWRSRKDVMAAYALVSAGILLPGCGADYTSSRKTPILENVVDMPELSLETVIDTWVKSRAETCAS